jgi:hypothetical protein
MVVWDEFRGCEEWSGSGIPLQLQLRGQVARRPQRHGAPGERGRAVAAARARWGVQTSGENGFTVGLLYAQERARANDGRRDYEPALRKASTIRARRCTQ